MSLSKIIYVDNKLCKLYDGLQTEFASWAKSKLTGSAFYNNEKLFQMYNRFFPHLNLKSIDNLTKKEVEELFSLIKDEYLENFNKTQKENIITEYRKHYLKEKEKEIEADIRKKIYNKLYQKYEVEYKAKIYDKITKPIKILNNEITEIDIQKYNKKELENKIKNFEISLENLKKKTVKYYGYYDIISKIIDIDINYCKKYITHFEYTHENNSDGIEYGGSSGYFSIKYTYKSVSGDSYKIGLKGKYENYGRYHGCDPLNTFIFESDYKKGEFDATWYESYFENDEYEVKNDDPRKIAFDIINKYEGNYDRLM